MADSLSAQTFISAFLTCFLGAFALYHLMVFRVNKYLDVDEKIPHSISFDQRVKLRDLYKTFYPRSPVYPFTTICATATLLLACGFAVFQMGSTENEKPDGCKPLPRLEFKDLQRCPVAILSGTPDGFRYIKQL
jgi:hypothetical protein